MTHIKHPYRWARKQLRLIGATCLDEGKDAADIRLKDGTTLRLSKRVTGAAAIQIVSRARGRLGIPWPHPDEGRRAKG